MNRAGRGSLLYVVVLWEIAARLMRSPMLPPPSKVGPTAIDLVVSGELLRHLAFSLGTLSLSFMAAALIGIVVGTTVAYIPPLSSLLHPIVESVRNVPALALFPLIILVLGLGVTSKAFVMFWTAWPAIVINTTLGLTSVDKEIREAGAIDGAGRRQLLRGVVFPLALPTIIVGLRIGLSGGWISLVSAEMLGARAGLGYATLTYAQTFRFAELYVVIVSIAVVGLLLNSGLHKWQKRVENGLYASDAEIADKNILGSSIRSLSRLGNVVGTILPGPHTRDRTVASGRTTDDNTLRELPRL